MTKFLKISFIWFNLLEELSEIANRYSSNSHEKNAFQCIILVEEVPNEFPESEIQRTKFRS